MSEISEAIKEHKKNCQELQTEKIGHIEDAMKSIVEKLDKLLEREVKYAVLESRLNTLEENLSKRTGQIISFVSMGISVLLALFVIIEKVAK